MHERGVVYDWTMRDHSLPSVPNMFGCGDQRLTLCKSIIAISLFSVHNKMIKIHSKWNVETSQIVIFKLLRPWGQYIATPKLFISCFIINLFTVILINLYKQYVYLPHSLLLCLFFFILTLFKSNTKLGEVTFFKMSSRFSAFPSILLNFFIMWNKD